MSNIPASISIACASAFWGDTPLAVAQVLRAPHLDYIVFDYLSEVTMTLLARMKKKDPHSGYTADFFTDVIEPHLDEISRRKIRLVANAGGVNAQALAEKIAAFALARSLPVKVAYVSGDDILGVHGLPESAHDLDGRQIHLHDLASANAYLGAAPVKAALDMGADIVITGRIVDTALVVGPAMHAFGWAWTDYDLIAQATLAGHIIECGTQATGGNFTDWAKVTGREDMGFPVVTLGADGRVEISKVPGTGGLLSEATVAEQIVYELGDPRSYLLPDVTCDFTGVGLRAVGEGRVEAFGARGQAPSSMYKVSATAIRGWKISTTAFVGGLQAREKAAAIGEAVLARARREILERGWGDYSETLIEELGGASEALLRVSAAHDKHEALDLLAKEIAPAATSLAPGVTNLLGGRAQAAPRVAFMGFLWPKNQLEISVACVGQNAVHKIFAHAAAIGTHTQAPVGAGKATFPPPLLAKKAATGATVQVPLVSIAYARSGDKGNDANIGVIARHPELFAVLKQQLTVERVREVFKNDLAPNSEILVWELPGLCALNFLVKNTLGGGGAYSLRIDPQGKAFAQRLLETRIQVPSELV